MVTVDQSKCTHCGICVRLNGGYCINTVDSGVVIDYTVCNECQKCVAVCPGMAFSNNGIKPVKIDKPLAVKPEDLLELMKRRRSVKHFKNVTIPKEQLARVVAAGSYAPTMNKQIEAIVIDDEALIRRIDGEAMRYYMRLYRLFFKPKPILWIIKHFAQTLTVIRRKMERDLITRGRIVKDNTQALIFLIGNTKIPVTEMSAQYYLANMLLYADLEGLGSCLMDSLKIAANRGSTVKKLLNIPKKYKVLGVLALGYSDEKILNIPEGYILKTGWNTRC